MDGTGKGFDRDLISKFNKHTSIPIIVSGGYREPNDIKKIKKFKNISGISIGSALHYSQNFNFDFRKFKEGNYEFLKSKGKNIFKPTSIKKLKRLL